MTSTVFWVCVEILYVVLDLVIHAAAKFLDDFTAVLHNPYIKQLLWGLCKGLSVASKKEWKSPPVTWAHRALQLSHNALD